MQTVLDLLGVNSKKYRQFQGHSLLPLMKDKTGAHKQPVISGGNRGRIALIDGDWKYYRYEDECKHSKSRCETRPDGGLKALSFSEELYNLHSDPLETNDVLDSNPEIALELRTLSANVTSRFVPYAPIRKDLDEQTIEQMKALGYVQ